MTSSLHQSAALVTTGLALSCSSVSEQATAQRWQAEICEEAREALLPAVRETESDVGRILSASYWRTNLPRADGETAVVLVDVSARIQLRGGNEDEVHLDVGYFENETCWTRYRWWGDFVCYDVGLGEPPGLTVTDEHTRRFLSVASYLATGGEIEAAAIEIAADRAFQVPMWGLHNKTSAPNHIDRWYYCQSCGNDRARIEGEVSLAGTRFGRSADATYFVTRSGWVARLRDTERQAAYALCDLDRAGG